MKDWRIKLSLFINYFIFGLLLNSVGTMIKLVQDDFGVSETSASVLEPFKDLSIAAASFILASYIARIGYRRAMLIAMGAISIVCAAIPFFPSFFAIKLLFLATGVCFAFVKVSIYGTIGLITDDKKAHASTMNFVESLFAVGIVSGYFVFGAFVDYAQGLGENSTAWLNAYFLFAFMGVVAFVLLWTADLDESKAHFEESKSVLANSRDIFVQIANSLVLVFIVSTFLYVLIEQSLMTWIPTFNGRVFNLDKSLAIEAAAMFSVFIAIGRFAGGFILKKLDWFTFVCGCLILATVIMVFSLSSIEPSSGSAVVVTRWADIPLAAYIFPLVGICIAPVYPALTSTILSALPRQKHAEIASLCIIFSALGGTTGSVITGALFGHYEGREQIAFYLVIVPIALLLSMLFLFKRRLAAKEA